MCIVLEDFFMIIILLHSSDFSVRFNLFRNRMVIVYVFNCVNLEIIIIISKYFGDDQRYSPYFSVFLFRVII